MFPRILFTLIALVLAACASAPVSIDYDPAASLPAMNTFALVAPAADANYQSLDNNRIQAALRQKLAVRGIKEVAADQADFQVAWRVEQQQKQENSGISFGVGFGSGNMGMGVSTGPKPKLVTEGRLVVDVVDPKRQQVVWTARGNQYLQDSMKPEQRDALVNLLVNEMFARFPPTQAQ